MSVSGHVPEINPDLPAWWPAWLRRWLEQHQRDEFPSLAVPAVGGEIADGVAYDGREKPDFVAEDDAGWKRI